MDSRSSNEIFLKYQERAEAGNQYGMWNLGGNYITGKDGSLIDLEKAVYWTVKSCPWTTEKDQLDVFNRLNTIANKPQTPDNIAAIYDACLALGNLALEKSLSQDKGSAHNYEAAIGYFHNAYKHSRELTESQRKSRSADQSFLNACFNEEEKKILLHLDTYAHFSKVVESCQQSEIAKKFLRVSMKVSTTIADKIIIAHLLKTRSHLAKELGVDEKYDNVLHEHSEYYHALAQLYGFNGVPKNSLLARKSLEALQKQEKYSYEIYLRITHAYLTTEHVKDKNTSAMYAKKAIMALAQSIKINNKNTTYLYPIIKDYAYDQDCFAETIKALLGQSITKDKTRLAILNETIDLIERLKYPHLALSQFMQYKKLLLERATIHHDNKNYAQSCSDHEKLVLFPDSESLIAYAHVLCDMGKYGDAINLFDKAANYLRPTKNFLSQTRNILSQLVFIDSLLDVENDSLKQATREVMMKTMQIAENNTYLSLSDTTELYQLLKDISGTQALGAALGSAQQISKVSTLTELVNALKLYPNKHKNLAYKCINEWFLAKDELQVSTTDASIVAKHGITGGELEKYISKKLEEILVAKIRTSFNRNAASYLGYLYYYQLISSYSSEVLKKLVNQHLGLLDKIVLPSEDYTALSFNYKAITNKDAVLTDKFLIKHIQDFISYKKYINHSYTSPSAEEDAAKMSEQKNIFIYSCSASYYLKNNMDNALYFIIKTLAQFLENPFLSELPVTTRVQNEVLAMLDTLCQESNKDISQTANDIKSLYKIVCQRPELVEEILKEKIDVETFIINKLSQNKNSSVERIMHKKHDPAIVGQIIGIEKKLDNQQKNRVVTEIVVIENEKQESIYPLLTKTEILSEISSAQEKREMSAQKPNVLPFKNEESVTSQKEEVFTATSSMYPSITGDAPQSYEVIKNVDPIMLIDSETLAVVSIPFEQQPLNIAPGFYIDTNKEAEYLTWAANKTSMYLQQKQAEKEKLEISAKLLTEKNLFSTTSTSALSSSASVKKENDTAKKETRAVVFST